MDDIVNRFKDFIAAETLAVEMTREAPGQDCFVRDIEVGNDTGLVGLVKVA
jgi:hypothetical protein